MNTIKKVSLIILGGLLLVLVSASFKGTNINDRAIVLGIGIDFLPDNGYGVSCEVLSADGSGDGAKQPKGNVFYAEGQSLGEALQNVYRKTGKEVSLGQCTLVVFGESAFFANVSECVMFFGYSDAFKESSAICVCQGSAKNLLSQSTLMGSSVTVTLAQTFQQAMQNSGVPSNNLLQFLRSQTELSRSGYVNYVTTETADENKTVFVVDSLVVFKNGNFVTIADKTVTDAVSYVNKNVKNHVLTVKNDTPTQKVPSVVSVGAVSTGYKTKPNNEHNRLLMQVKLDVRQLRTDSANSFGILGAKTFTTLPQNVLDSITQQVTEKLQTVVNFMQQYNVDVADVFKSFCSAYGKMWRQKCTTMSLSDISFEIAVSVTEE